MAKLHKHINRDNPVCVRIKHPKYFILLGFFFIAKQHSHDIQKMRTITLKVQFRSFVDLVDFLVQDHVKYFLLEVATRKGCGGYEG